MARIKERKIKYSKEDIQKIVLVVNEIHHNYMDTYHATNSIMHGSERENWKSELTKHNFKGKSILEIGTGTGFLPLLFIELHIPFKRYTCTDISNGILEQAKTKIGKAQDTGHRFSYVKLNDKRLPFTKRSYDFIIMNSVLHHLPDIDFFFSEAFNILKEGGILIIGHEPNLSFHQNLFLQTNYKFIGGVFSILGEVKNLLYGKEEKPRWIEETNKELKRKGLITANLSRDELGGFIDFHATKGINPKKFPRGRFALTSLKTYNYLATLNFAYRSKAWTYITKLYDWIFSAVLKENGGMYFAVYKKIAEKQ